MLLDAKRGVRAAQGTALRPSVPGRVQGREGGNKKIRVMIVDDSAVARAILSRMVAADDDFDVVVQASNAEQALDALETTLIDVVTLDVEMPGTDGLTALPHIIKAGRGARVLIVSSIAEDGAAATVKALSLGAADTIPKPGGGRAHGNFAQSLLSKMRTIGQAHRDEERIAPPPVADARLDLVRLRPMSSQPIRCLTIGASTGGLYALGNLLGALPARIGIPILVTQHLPAVFMPFFARQLATLTGREAEVAEDGAELVADHILIAPGDGHLRLKEVGWRLRVHIDRDGAIGGCLPAIDPMFDSVAEHFGAGACAVVLTGMGRDGSVGSARLADMGGSVLVQDPASSAVWGMPRSVAEGGYACAVLDPAGIARRIAARIGTRSTGLPSWK